MSRGILLTAEKLWLIRRIKGDEVRYMESYKMWNKSPAHATIFQDYDAACQEQWIAQSMFPLQSGETSDVVTMYGSLVSYPKARKDH